MQPRACDPPEQQPCRKRGSGECTHAVDCRHRDDPASEVQRRSRCQRRQPPLRDEHHGNEAEPLVRLEGAEGDPQHRVAHEPEPEERKHQLGVALGAHEERHRQRDHQRGNAQQHARHERV